MSAVHTDLAFTGGPVGAHGCGCNTGCQGGAMVFRSVWDRLVMQLFGATPPGMDNEYTLPDINIWNGGVVMTEDENPYSFVVMSETDEAPKPADVIFYKGKYYVIGAVDEQ